MKRIVKAGHCVAAATLLLVACGKTSTTADDAPAAAGASTAGEGAATRVNELPLKRGFYVSADTACGQASNATLLLLRRDGLNGARDSCDFASIEQTGPQSFRVVEQCEAAESVVWQVPDESSFSTRSESGWERSFRHCEQSSLPDPWRDNDISDILAAAR